VRSYDLLTGNEIPDSVLTTKAGRPADAMAPLVSISKEGAAPAYLSFPNPDDTATRIYFLGKPDELGDLKDSRQTTGSLTLDGRFFIGSHATADQRFELMVWDVAKRVPVQRVHGRATEQFLAISPDGKRVATAFADSDGRNHSIYVRDCATLAPVRLIDSGPFGAGYAAAFTRHGEKLVIAGDESIQFWDIKTGREHAFHRLTAVSAGFYLAGDHLIAAAPNGQTHLWRLTNGIPLRKKKSANKGREQEAAEGR
jgi:WD40 repeat protein